MSRNVGFPNFSGQPGQRFETMVVTEASVSSSAFTTAGLDARGSFLATIKQTSSGNYSVAFNQTYADVPVVVPSVQTAGRVINNIVPSTSGFTFTTTNLSGTAEDDVVISFFLCLYTSNQIFS